MGSNIFGIQRPEMIECMVYDYKWGRQLMTIRMKRENSPEVYYLRLAKVEFFAGPMLWRGADFEIRPASECLEVLQLIGRVSEFADESHIKQLGYNLFSVDVGDVKVQIIAAKAHKYSG